jgi:cell division protein FtsI/penicillin-binding protein 2
MRRPFRLKLRILSGLLLVFVAFLVLKLYFVQVVYGSDYALKAERQYVNRSEAVFDRGSIYFTRKDGTLISAATLGTGFLIAINPSELEHPLEAYELIQSYVPISKEDFFALAEKHDDPYEVVVRKVDEETGKKIANANLPGVIVERERWRLYPGEARGARTIGFLGYNDDDALIGRYGLERYYNDVLTRDADGLFGNFFAELFANVENVVSDARDAKEGDLITTIEPVVEDKLGQILKATHARYQSVETSGIIMNPKTGEIIALDTYPTFDPNQFRNADPEHFGNPLVEHRHEFGSIMKPLTMAVGIDTGAVSPDTTYNDMGCITLNTKKICNFDLEARGVVPMQEVLSQSLNLGASFIAGRVGHDTFRDYFTRLGFGTETGIDLPSETHGSIQNLNSPRDVEYATASFGQGIDMTPVGMIRALSTLANGGEAVTPHLVKEIRLRNGITKELSWGEPERVFSSDTVEEVTKMLVTVVDESLAGGTAKIPELSVAAKTGTAQVADPSGGYYDNRYFHSFFGYFPAYDPEFVILLYTRHPQGVRYASETLTEPFLELTKFLMSYYGISPDRATP